MNIDLTIWQWAIAVAYALIGLYTFACGMSNGFKTDEIGHRANQLPVPIAILFGLVVSVAWPLAALIVYCWMLTRYAKDDLP